MTKALTIHQKSKWSSGKDIYLSRVQRLQFESACSSCVKAVRTKRLKHYETNEDVCLRKVCCS